MATHSSILVWRIPWTEEPGGYSPLGRRESDRTERLPQQKKKKSLSILFAEKVSFPNTKKSSLNVNVKCLFRNLLSAVRY